LNRWCDGMFPARDTDSELTRGHGRRVDSAPFRVAAHAPGGGAERLCAFVLGRYLHAIAGRGTVTYVDANGERVDVDAIDGVIANLLASSTPLIVTYWIADALAVAMLPIINDAFGTLLRSVTCVVDDTFAGRAAGRYIDGIGGRTMLVALPGEPERLRQVHALMRGRTSCAFPVDGGGPYREVATGIITLAMALRATVVPIAAVARPALPSIHRSRVRLPMPNAKLVVGVGEALRVAARPDRRLEASRLRESLDRLGGVIRAISSSPCA
jgi:lysophospholipid acyltransferase (LPLAT)-like uncharacterized protein